MIKFRNLEGWVIEHEMSFFRSYLNDIEQALKDESAKLKQDWEALKKEEDPDDHEDCLIERNYELRQHFGVFYSSFIITIFSFVEHELDRICSTFSVRNKSKIVLRDMHGKGIQRAKLFMEKVCNFTLPEENLWEKLEQINEIRNHLIHSGGEINSDKRSLIDYIKNLGETKIKIEEDIAAKINRIEITKGYCSFVVGITEEYLLTLIDKNVQGERW